MNYNSVEEQHTEEIIMAQQLDLNHGFYYSTLSAAQKKTYDELLTNMRQFLQEFSLNPVSTNDYLIANRAVLDDHPELWWADTPARYYFNMTGKVNKHQFLQLSGNEKQLTANMEKAVVPVVQKAAAMQNDWQKALYFHDLIIQNTRFNTGSDTDGYGDQNVSSVFLGGNSVCAGYSRAFQLLCRSAGIECIYVTGPATKNGQTISHAWNLAYIEGNWTYIDCTWDDLILENGTESIEHDYFCLNDTWIKKDHPIPTTIETGNNNVRQAIKLPSASTLNMEYHRVTGTYFEKFDVNTVGASVQKQGSTGHIRLRFGSTAELKKACQVLVDQNNLTANAQLRVSKDDAMCVLRIDKK